MRSQHRLGLAFVVLGCSSFPAGTVPPDAPRPDIPIAPDTPPLDAPSIDAPSIDAPSIDAPSIDAPDVINDTPDVAPLDAVDVPPDMGPVRCVSSGDCVGNPEGLVCDAATGRCVPCTATDDRCPTGQYCAAMMNRCVPGCRGDDACAMASGDGGVALRRCDASSHQCVECVSDEHCAPGNLCMGDRCVPGCSASRACPSGQSCCNGGCVDSQTNIDHCGACGQACNVANASAACVAGRCAVGTCTMPFADCDGMAANGCEVNTTTSSAHCGACGRTCTGGTCAASTCTCPSGRTLCNGACVDLMTDRDNCGACGYRVIAAGRPGEASQRACVVGAPTPAWVPMSNTGRPAAYFNQHNAAWTGRRFIVVMGTQAWSYDPSSDTWTMAPSAPHSVGVGVAWMPHLNRVFFVHQIRGTGEPPGVIFDDSGAAPVWREVQRSGAIAMTTDGDWQTPAVYHRADGNDYIFVLRSLSDPEAIARYDLARDTWTRVMAPISPHCTQQDPYLAPWVSIGTVLAGYGGGSGCDERYRTFNPSTMTQVLNLLNVPFGGTGVRAQPALNATVLSVGSLALIGGGWTYYGGMRTDGNWGQWALVDSSGARTVLRTFPEPAPAAKGFAMFTGRSVIHWGGWVVNYEGRLTRLLSGGSIGVVSAGDIAWRSLPTSGQPSARGTPFIGTYGFANTQPYWTGAEAIIWGGSSTEGSGDLLDGARYQPPVGCVCPRNADAPAWLPSPCAGVTNIATAACNP